MLQKRDLQLIRLAVRRRWLTAEEGEDCLFLKRKFGAKYTIEEVIRRRGYLDDDNIQELSDATDALVRRRVVPGLFKRRDSTETGTREPPPQAPSARPVPVAPSVRPTPSRRPAPVAPSTRPAPAAPSRSLPPVPAPPPLPPKPREQSGFSRPIVPPPSALLKAPIGEDQVEDSDEFTGEKTVVDFQIGDVLGDRAPPPLTRPSQQPPPRSDTVWDPRPAPISEREAKPFLQEERTVVGVVTDLLAKLRSSQPAPPPLGPPKRSSIPPPSIEGEETAGEEAFAPSRIVERAPSIEIETPGPLILPSEDTDSAPSMQGLDPSIAAAYQPTARGPVAEQPPPLPIVVRQPSVVQPSALTFEDALAAEGPDEELGPEFGPFAIKRRVGRGAMGTVYLAEPKGGGEPIALKVLHPAVAKSPDLFARFRREATATTTLRSPHVVPVLGTGRVGDRHYLAMRYVDGWTLGERIDSGDAPNALEAARITRDIARALDAAESAGLIHRDVKPENILIARDGSVYLTDFGLAREAGSSVITSSQDVIVGTPNYMAPEQAVGHELDIRADLYSLGATLFHVLAKRPVFPGRSSVSIIAKHVRLPAPDVRLEDESIPESLAGVVAKLLQKRPEDRYQRPADLIFDLEQIITSLEAVSAPVVAAVAAPKRLAVPSLAVSATILFAAICAALVARVAGWTAWGQSGLVVQTALLGAVFVGAALVLLGALGLVRRGELPLPGSTGWLVGAKELSGMFGAAAIVTSATLGPPALLSVGSAILAVIVLGSWTYGFLLRRQVAAARADRGVGHVLAVLGDPQMILWRRKHVPLLTLLAFFSAARFALLAYFQAAN